MDWLVIVCGCVCVVLFVLLISAIYSNDFKNVILVSGLSVLANVLFFMFIWLLLDAITIYKNIPTAMDVYRGNVELDITYKINNRGDTISCDSVIVFKKDIPK